MVYGVSATSAGLSTIPLILTLCIFDVISGFVTARTGRYMTFVYISSVLMTAGITMISFLKSDSSTVVQVFALIVLGVGIGCLIQIYIIGSQAAVDSKNVAVATAVTTFCMILGGTLSVAITGTILNNIFISEIASKPLLETALTSLTSSDLQDPINLRAQLQAVDATALAELVDSFLAAFSLAYRCTLPYSVSVFVSGTCCQASSSG